MTTVRIGPPVVNATDILEYALALIEEHGWRQGPRVPDNEDWPEVAKNGLSLHDSIGMACYMLSGEAQTQTRSAPRSTGYGQSKDFPVSSRANDYGYHGSLREQATGYIEKATGGVTDIEFNDAAGDAAEVLDVLRKAITESEATS